jgi:hypothetical protein
LNNELRHEREAFAFMVDEVLGDLDKEKKPKANLKMYGNVLSTDVKPTLMRSHHYDDDFEDISEDLEIDD